MSSHRLPVSDEDLESSMQIIRDAYNALSPVMTEEENLLESMDPRARRVTPHQVMQLANSSVHRTAILEDTAIRRGFRRMAKLLRLQQVERDQALQEFFMCARYEARMDACTIEAAMSDQRERVRVARLRVRAANALAQMRETQLIRQIKATETSINELIAREAAEGIFDLDLEETESLNEIS